MPLADMRLEGGRFPFFGRDIGMRLHFRYSTGALGAAIVLLAASVAAQASGPAGARGLPPGLGRDDVINACAGCHDISTVTSTRQSAALWKATVSEMISRGAQVDDAAAGRIVAYLAARFGPPAG